MSTPSSSRADTWQGASHTRWTTLVLPKQGKLMLASSMELRVQGGVGKGPQDSAASIRKADIVVSIRNSFTILIHIAPYFTELCCDRLTLSLVAVG